MKYSIPELRVLWERYHDSVHNPKSATPCDACPDDPCYTTSFLDWLEKEEHLAAR